MASIAALVAITDTAASSMEHMAARTATWATAVASTTVAEDFMVAGSFMVVGEAVIVKA